MIIIEGTKARQGSFLNVKHLKMFVHLSLFINILDRLD